MATDVKPLAFDKHLVWDPKNLKEVDEAKASLRAWKKMGYRVELSDGSEMEFFRPHYIEAVVKAGIPKAKYTLRILDDTGDTVITWDKEDGAEALEAKKKLYEHLKKGGTAYTVRKDGTRKRMITEFDVDSQELILDDITTLVPKTVGR
jgi:hypothetical protein